MAVFPWHQRGAADTQVQRAHHCPPKWTLSGQAPRMGTDRCTCRLGCTPSLRASKAQLALQTQPPCGALGERLLGCGSFKMGEIFVAPEKGDSRVPADPTPSLDPPCRIHQLLTWPWRTVNRQVGATDQGHAGRAWPHHYEGCWLFLLLEPRSPLASGSCLRH